ncbi:hypothetical protein FCOL_12460 [Flavobacterium columnare ATCC 49512]|uniref:Superinfection exclusion protein B n=1 Tax=Flavobacterium columnare (strain ATCC 49512 / CIP 103533 / TG 44/87) TaxID=1041826 RepID=G8X9U3_FLACA|nr:superinfection exclusion B family protein [Flavobacterium columnare]AEW87291.1 hypothetical protein FCOL_12460 [Flavobacterium columnare ATCC 49512]MBF6654746.1 hypothetical protein [Flavobacterium columnare]
MMDNFFTKLLDFNKIPTKLFVLISLVSGSLLFLPNSILENLKLSKFETDYGKYFGIAFLFSTGILIMNFIIWLTKKVLLFFLKIKYDKKLESELNDLDRSEKAVLREFYINNQSSIKLPLDDATVKNLLNKRILIRISEMGEFTIGGMLFPMKINDKIKNKINKDVLGIPNLKNDNELRNFIVNSRPDWAKEIDGFKRLF